MNVKDLQYNVRWKRETDPTAPSGSPHRCAEAQELRIDDPADTASDADYESVCCQATQWRLHPGWKDVLLGRDGLRLAEWVAGGQASVVKSRSHRVVYRVDVPQGSFYVKEYRTNAWRDVLRDWLRGNRARREWRRLQCVRCRGIATVTPLAVGLPRRPHRAARAWLITAAENAQPLDHYLEQVLPALPSADRTHARQHLAQEFARFVASLHEAGAVHRDLHPGNVLIGQPCLPGEAHVPRRLREGPAKTAEPCPNRGLVLVDLQAVSLRRRAAETRDSRCGAAAPLDWRRTRRNLVTVNLYFSQHATRADRRRFWRHYLACRPGLVADPRNAARHLEEQTDRAARRFWRKRDRRCLRQGRYFYCCARRGARALAVRDLPEAALEALLNQPDVPFETARAQILKHSSGSQVARLKLPDGLDGIPCVYKRWQPRSFRDRLMSRLRTSKAMHAWRMGHALLARGIATPRPLAVIESRSRAQGPCCYLLWEEIENAQHLHDAAECLSAMPPMARRRAASRLATRLARLLRRLHDCGFDHRDLKAANILVQGPPETPEGIYLLDLDAVRRRRRTVDVTRRLRDLSRLLVSFYRSSTVTRSAKLSCFDNYLHGGLESHEDWKARCRQMDRRAQRKIRRNQRRGRVIA